MKAGAGKTVLTYERQSAELLYLQILTSGLLRSIVVDYLERSFEQEDVAIAYIYCSYKEQEDQTDVNLIASLLQQLV